jgi:hypothetical protein
MRAMIVATLLLALASILSPVPPPAPNATIFNGLVEDLTGTPVATGSVTFTLRPGVDSTISGNARFTPTSVVCTIANPAVVSTSGTGTITLTVATPQTWQMGDNLIFFGTADSALNATNVAAPVTISGVTSPTIFTFTFAGTHTNGALGTVGGLFAAAGTGPCAVTQNSAINPAYTSYSVAIQPNNTTTSTFNTYAIGPGPVDISTIVPTPSQQPSYSFLDLFSNGQTVSGLKNFTNTANTYSGGTFNNPILNSATFNGTTAANWLLTTPTIQQPTFTTQPITLASTFNYSITWANPAAARSLVIQDPGGNDNFAYVAAAQTLLNKTLGAGTSISGAAIIFSNHGHTAVGDVGLVTTGATKAFTAQSASIGSTLLLNYSTTSTQALVAVHYRLVTDGAAGAGTVSWTLAWNDCANGVGFTTKTSSTIALGTPASDQDGVFVICPATAFPISFTTTDSSPGTGTYALTLWAEVE